MNYSDRASELGGIVNLVDRRRSSLLRCERPPCRAKFIIRFGDRYNGDWYKVPEGSTIIFGGTRISF